MSKEDKAERLAAQLRENLRRRKAQARATRLAENPEHNRDPEEDHRQGE
ncbi:hypothetical protein OMW55_09195 [Sphingomonas sp. BN140010]|uniref:DUF4169 domain-containing protein n=1 Tax=Sphingomonas arvum TaxID=2992113 RepID=A0ABT3JFW9_9SPHN|nr:hypothetical protein [Sphingomonas sp. BN140010]MCW3797977.1 hypothetical protein [Sphingomonas sp. BN140010]